MKTTIIGAVLALGMLFGTAAECGAPDCHTKSTKLVAKQDSHGNWGCYRRDQVPS